MTNSQIQITQEYLHYLFEYRDGQFIWKINTSRNKMVGNIAGTKKQNGYISIQINKKQYLAHRLIYLYHNGYLDKDLVIDHINMIKDDNRIENLRLVTHQENRFNTKAIGYTFDTQKGKFKANITTGNKLKHLGYFDNKEDARNAYLKGKEKYHIIDKH